MFKQLIKTRLYKAKSRMITAEQYFCKYGSDSRQLGIPQWATEQQHGGILWEIDVLVGLKQRVPS